MFRKAIFRISVMSFIVSACLVGMLDYSEAQTGCSLVEKNRISSYYQAIMQALLVGNVSQYLQLLQNLENELSPACRTALAQSQQLQNAQPNIHGGDRYNPPGVYDHGGGTFSVPGVGACGPNGCIPY